MVGANKKAMANASGFKEMSGVCSPREMCDASGPKEMCDVSSPKEMFGTSAPREISNASAPKEITGACAFGDISGFSLPREMTRHVNVGNVEIGAGAPIAVQTMLSTPTSDVELAIKEIDKVADIGCEIVRLAVPSADVLDAFQEICVRSKLPVVADIHFDPRLAVESAKRGASKLRINPGNIGSTERVDAVIDAAGEAGIPIRIGVNAGSLETRIREAENMSQEQKLVLSVEGFVEHFESRGFYDIVVSAKAHDVATTVKTYELLSSSMPEIPLHLGVTEAGTLRQGTVKSAIGLGILLSRGIGDTFRVSLTSDIADEVAVAWEILQACGLRRLHPEIVSCPTCGRTQIDLIPIAKEVTSRLKSIKKPISVAVMGCVVNGPGEARDADIGVAAGKGEGAIFVHGEIIRKVPEDEIIDALFEEIENM